MTKLVLTWGKDENTRVEDVRPAHVRSGGKVVGEVKEVRKRADREDVGIEEEDFRVLGQSEDMQFGKDRGKVGTTWQPVLVGGANILTCQEEERFGTGT